MLLPDGQELRGRLHARGQVAGAGWMYWVALPMWAGDPDAESVEPREYRVWLGMSAMHGTLQGRLAPMPTCSLTSERTRPANFHQVSTPTHRHTRRWFRICP